MHIKRLLLAIVFSLILFTSYSYALDIAECQDLNEDYLDQNLVLTQDINDWVGSCFNVNFTDSLAGVSSYMYFDCNNHSIDFNIDSNSFVDLNSGVISLHFIDCDFNTQLSEVANSVVNINDGLSYIGFTNSSFLLGNNLINFFDSNISGYDLELSFNNLNIDVWDNLVYLYNTYIDDLTISDLNITTNYSGLDTAVFHLDENSGINNLSFSNSQINFDGNGLLFSISDTNYDSIIDFNSLDLNMQNYSQLFSLRGFNNRFEGINLTFKNLNLDENNYNSQNSIIKIADTRLNLDLNDSNIFDLDASFIGRTTPPGEYLTRYYNEYFSLNINNSYLDGFAIIYLPYLHTFSGTPLISYNSGDINSVYLESVGLDSIDYFFDMSNYDLTDDNNLQFEFNGIDANYIGFNGVNTLTEYTSESDIYFLSIDQLGAGYDLNYIEFNDSNIIMTSDIGLNLSNINDDYLNIFGNSSIGGATGINILDSNILELELSDLILSGIIGINLENTDLNIFNLFNLSLIGLQEDGHLTHGAINFSNLVDNQMDINLYGTVFYSGECAVMSSIYFGDNIDHNEINISNFSTSNLLAISIRDINADDGVTDINTINIFDSDINSLALLYVDENTILEEFNAYNNIFRDVNIDVNYFGQYNDNIGELNLNSILDENKSSRLKLLNDDSSYIGGNLWFDSEGNNLCSHDSLNPKGICDNNLSFIIFDLNTLDYSEAIDYYPLISYTTSGGGGGDVGSGSFDLILAVNPTSEISVLNDLNLLINITKKGGKKSNDFDYSIYAYEDTQKIKLRDGLDYNNSSLPLTILEQINYKDLDGNILEYIDNNKIKFVVQINVSGDDKLFNNNQVFFVNAYFVEQRDENVVDENLVININDSSEDYNKKIIKDTNYDSIYLMTYKEEIGLNEIQIITIFDENKNVISNVNILIFSEDINYYFSTDSNGNVFFKPEKIGIYEIFVPNNDPKINGKFDVILENNSSENFVEVYANNTKKGMSVKQRNTIIFGVSGVILISILGIILYLVFRVKKPNFYDFTQTETYSESPFYKNQLAEKYKKEIVEANQEERNLYDKIKPKFG